MPKTMIAIANKSRPCLRIMSIVVCPISRWLTAAVYHRRSPAQGNIILNIFWRSALMRGRSNAEMGGDDERQSESGSAGHWADAAGSDCWCGDRIGRTGAGLGGGLGKRRGGDFSFGGSYSPRASFQGEPEARV